jgi:hypothetical protein
MINRIIGMRRVGLSLAATHTGAICAIRGGSLETTSRMIALARNKKAGPGFLPSRLSNAMSDTISKR